MMMIVEFIVFQLIQTEKHEFPWYYSMSSLNALPWANDALQYKKYERKYTDIRCDREDMLLTG